MGFHYRRQMQSIAQIEGKGLIYREKIDDPKKARAWMRRMKQHFAFPHLYPRAKKITPMQVGEVHKVMVRNRARPDLSKVRKEFVEMFSNRPIHKVGIAGVAAFIAHLKSRNLAAATINKKLRALDAMFDYARWKGWIDGTPKIELLQVAPVTRKMPTWDEMVKAIDLLNPPTDG